MLWITLLSRIGNDVVRIRAYPAFWSLAEIANGNRRAIYETAENVILFLPFGFFCRRLFGLKRRFILLCGLMLSLAIECGQLLTGLGSFEVDDLCTNTFGSFIGALVPAGSGKPGRWLLPAAVAFLLALCVPFGFNKLLSLRMEKLAGNLDRADGAKNLLVLNGRSGFAGDSDVFVSFLPDGCIRISGSSDKRAWLLIGELTLSPGTYTFSGLSGTEDKTFAIELEYYNEEAKKFIRLTPDVGPIDETGFTLNNQTNIRAYVGVYSGASGTHTACPVIYKEQ